jgi:hypothetical protein
MSREAEAEQRHRNWDEDFDLADWQALDPKLRKEWIEQAWDGERDEDLSVVYAARKKRIQRGQTVWAIGLQPYPFDQTLAAAVGEVKSELHDGKIFWDEERQLSVLSALLANTGLRRTVELAPREVWVEALRRQQALAAWERDRYERSRIVSSPGMPTPVVRAEFVRAAQPDAGLPFYWVRSLLAHPFHKWDAAQRDQGSLLGRVAQLGYIAIGVDTLTRVDVLVYREPIDALHTWPIPSDIALAAYVANTEGATVFDWQVRRPALLEAGTEEIWVINTNARRVLTQRQGEEPREVAFSDPGQTMTWRDNAGNLIIELSGFLGGLQGEPATPIDENMEFATFNAAQRERLRRFETPWTVGHTPQWFSSSIVDLLGQFKDELWQGVLFGAEYQRDELLSALLANVGLETAFTLAPLELWRQALEE